METISSLLFITMNSSAKRWLTLTVIQFILRELENGLRSIALIGVILMPSWTELAWSRTKFESSIGHQVYTQFYPKFKAINRCLRWNWTSWYRKTYRNKSLAGHSLATMTCFSMELAKTVKLYGGISEAMRGEYIVLGYTVIITYRRWASMMSRAKVITQSFHWQQPLVLYGHWGQLVTVIESSFGTILDGWSRQSYSDVRNLCFDGRMDAAHRAHNGSIIFFVGKWRFTVSGHQLSKSTIIPWFNPSIGSIRAAANVFDKSSYKRSTTFVFTSTGQVVINDQLTRTRSHQLFKDLNETTEIDAAIGQGNQLTLIVGQRHSV